MSECFFLPPLLLKLIVYITLHSDWTSLHSQTTLCSFTFFALLYAVPSIWNVFLHHLHLLFLVNSSIFNTQIKCCFLYETAPVLFRKNLFFLPLCFQNSLGPFGGTYHIVVKFLCLYATLPSSNLQCPGYCQAYRKWSVDDFQVSKQIYS